MAFIDELMKLQGKQMGRTPPAAMPTAPQAPAPQVGPTIASAPFDPLSFFEGRTEGTPAPTGGVQPESPFISNPALEGMTPDFARQMNVPSEILTRPEAPTATSTTGQVAIQPPVSDFTRGEVSPIIGQAPSERGQPFAAPTTMAGEERQFDPNAALESPLTAPPSLGTPTSESGIGTSIVNDVNFLQEGLNQVQAPPEMTDAEKAMEAHGIAAGTRPGAGGIFATQRTGGPDGRDRDRRGTMSMEDATQLTGGDRDAARALLKRQELGMGEFKEEKDTRTPEKIESDRLAVEAQEKRNQLLDQQIEAGRSPNATPAEKESAALAQGVKDGTITQEQADEARKQKLLGKPPALYDTWAEYEAKTGTDADGDGKVATEAEAAEATPSDTPTEFPAGTRRKQGGKVYEFDGSKWDEVK